MEPMNPIQTLLQKYRSLSAPVKASVWALFCSVFQSAASLVTTPVFTRLLTQAEFGVYSQYSSWLAILSILVTLNLYSETYIKGLSEHEAEEDAFTASMLWMNLLIFGCFLIVFLLAPSFWAKVLHLSPYLTGLMFVHLFVSNPFDYWKSRERYHFRYRLSTLLSVAVTVFSYAFSIYAVTHYSNRLNARIEGDLVIRILIGLPLLVILLRKTKYFYNKEIWGYALAFSLPLIPHYLSNIILNQSDRLMIGRLVGDAEAAKYSIAYMIASMVLMIVTAVNSSYVPYTFQKLRDKDLSSVRRSSSVLLAGIALLCVIGMGLAPEVITIFAGESYAEAALIVPDVSASVFFIFVYTLFSNVEYYYKETKLVGIATLLAAGLNVALNAVLIPKLGYTIAGTTTLVSYLFLALFHYVCYRMIQHKEQFEALYDLRAVILISAALLGITLVIRTLFGLTLIRYLIVAASVPLSVWLLVKKR